MIAYVCIVQNGGARSQSKTPNLEGQETVNHHCFGSRKWDYLIASLMTIQKTEYNPTFCRGCDRAQVKKKRSHSVGVRVRSLGINMGAKQSR
ncbi:hypothetical protein PN441_13580 [Spirulina major CS-329]|uniref:hypothetical protein n=1 Tax=Spirulina TaxID=1154 RepID=UPI00232F81F5|nr:MULTISPECIES: hypothetical protein [Spirulina]MDB9494875.1 hypothetical protein [Spirulina subsalsa CS-330]MDB9504102.1 hypothetical protein [Spirulina major CS-329]